MPGNLTVTVKVTNVRETLDKFKELPDEAREDLKDASNDIARDLANKIRESGRAEGSQAAIVADSVKVNRGAVPSVTAGGSRAVGRYRKPAGALVFGSEFGVSPSFRSGWYADHRFKSDPRIQYKPRNATGYWFFPSVDEFSGEMDERWNEAADTIVERFSEGG